MKDVSILLFNPPTPDGRAYTREGRCTQEAGIWGTQWPPLSLATVAALLRRDDHHVTLRDYPATGMDSRTLANDVQYLQPTFAIWSTGTPTLRHDLALARIVREKAPEAVTAVIGTHVTVRPEEALDEAALTAVIRGEPEGIIRDLCRSGGAFGEVAGLSWRNSIDSTIRHNPDAAPLEPEAIPAADWDGLDLDGYRLPLKGRRFLMVAPIRGCPWQCVFCTAPLYYGSRIRPRPVADVVAEMAENVERYGVYEFFFWADTFTADRGYVRELCRTIVESGLRIAWTCNSRVDTIDEETLLLMKEAGLWMISYGLESGNDAILAASGKGITVAQSRAAVELTHQLGIRIAGHFMFGLPGETERTMAETLALALDLPIDIAQFYVAAPFPGTMLFDQAKQKGWLEVSSDAAPAASQSNAIMELPDLPSTWVDAYRRYAYRRFYLRPQAAARVLSMVEFSAVTDIMSSVRRFFRWLR